jgi:predicted Zn-dependent peptidase
LSNGTILVTEKHPHVRSASAGVWVCKGTRHETPSEGGAAHFVEHLVFKGTERRSAFEISRDMEAVGGDLNAYTSRENTAFVATSLGEDLNLSLEILSDLVSRPLFDADEIEKEKQVVCQEIRMAEDVPEDIIYDILFDRVYKDQPLGRSILGTLESVQGQTQRSVRGFYERFYEPNNLMVSVAGRLEHDEVEELLERELTGSRPRVEKGVKKSAGGKIDSTRRLELVPRTVRESVERDSEQIHALVAWPTVDFRSPRRFAAYVLNAVLGGGLTSRLYQRVREERGLVYSIYSQLTTFSDTGLMSVYAGTEENHLLEVLQLIRDELEDLRRKGVKRSELDLYKTQVRGQLLIGSEDIENRMNSLAINEMIFGEYRSVKRVIEDVQAVDLDLIQETIEQDLRPESISVLLLGPQPEQLADEALSLFR